MLRCLFLSLLFITMSGVTQSPEECSGQVE
jgi:hypothetical protein